MYSPIFINTRPAPYHTDLTQALTQSGIDVLDLPLLTLKPIALNATEHAQIRQVWQNRYKIILIISRMAGTLASDFLWQAWMHFLTPWANLSTDLSTDPFKNLPTDLNNQPIPDQAKNRLQNLAKNTIFITVGTASHLALKQGLQKFDRTVGMALNWQILTPDLPDRNNEGMLKLKPIRSLKSGDRILIFKGTNGRTLLAKTLENQGVLVDQIPCYQRQTSPILPDQLQTILNIRQTILSGRTRAFVLISSQQTLLAWQQLLQQADRLHQDFLHQDFEDQALAPFFYLTLGQRLTDILSQKTVHYQAIATLDPNEILTQITQISAQ